MKTSFTVKFIAIALCAAALLTAAMSGLGLATLASENLLGDTDYAEFLAETTERMLDAEARCLAELWASVNYGDMPEDVARIKYDITHWDWLSEEDFSFTISDAEGEPLYSCRTVSMEQEKKYVFLNTDYELFLGQGQLKETEKEDGVYHAAYYGQHSGVQYNAKRETLDEPIQVTLRLAPDAIRPDAATVFLGQLSSHRTALYAAVLAGLLAFAILAVYLCIAAGCRKGTEEIKAGGLNLLPLDLYACGVVMVLSACVLILKEVGMRLLQRLSIPTVLYLIGTMGYVCCLAFVGFCFAFAAQLKMKDGHWFWNTITGRCLKLGCWIVKKCWALCGQVIPVLWQLLCRIVRAGWKFSVALLVFGWETVKKLWHWGCVLMGRGLRRLEVFFSLLPVTWQWLLVGGVLVGWLVLALCDRNGEWFFLGCVASVLVVGYGANVFGMLLSGVKKMRSGELEGKIDDKLMVGSFREFAGELNGLADVAMAAAQRQLKSERMKTELITNVSHDIKTPLTSIINYVDLLEKPHTPEEEKTYLEVLNRQSHRMKKLIEDLMEMSKASTGNIPVEIARIDAVEAVNQALGEFTDKLEHAGLVPVFHHTEEVYLLADGRLLWRTMSNILSNAVKYALAGTRLYVDVAAVDDHAVISFKNISGAQLNISADELMERFVRGDSSRNTEGSGLGLNIAKSLMELQKGQLQLLVDGDLFKVTLIFPRAE